MDNGSISKVKKDVLCKLMVGGCSSLENNNKVAHYDMHCSQVSCIKLDTEIIFTLLFKSQPMLIYSHIVSTLEGQKNTAQNIHDSNLQEEPTARGYK